MLDHLSQIRTPLAGWVWTETRNIKFDTIFCPFTGRPFVPLMFKEQGKGVITTDLLVSYYQASRALIENDTSYLDAFDVDKLLEKNEDSVQLIEGLCNAYGIAPEHGAWLDNVHKNIEKLDDPLKQSLAVMVCTRVIRYLMAFDDSTRIVMPDDDIMGVFHYYVEFLNGKIFSNGRQCEAYNEDAYKLAQTVETDAMYFYLPSSIGFDRLSPERRMLELFCRYCNESELDKRLLVDSAHLGATQTDLPHYKLTLETFLEAAAHIPLWIISYNRAGVFTEDTVKGIIAKFKPDVKVHTRKMVYSSSEIYTECLYIARK